MIVVTGATGNVGRPLVEALAAVGEQVTAVSRRPGGTELPEGVRHHQADLADPGSLRPALDGADALFLLFAGELLTGERPVRELLETAGSAGVRRVVVLSSQAAETRPQAISHAPLRALEEAVRASGLDWTVLRPGGFGSNAFAWAESVRTRRTVAAPFGDVGLPVVDPADIAEVAAATLRGRGHAGRTYELTGPAPVSPRQQAQTIGDALGEPVRFTELSREQARAELLRFMPEPVADGTLDILGEPTAAEQRVSPDVERVLGRPPRAFADWAMRNIAAFR
ncbi:NAD(P)H-binding protein [Streptomyces violaceusniger]|uniref:NAD(P)H-binding protein n=1 Tax=Streptomyces TaxID=1883 RepID=UPI0009974B66|nr:MULTISPECIES: NAD(P)H-binding protein [Streptomyces]AQW54005.1 NmrA family transcriptional regulator [Streptomyces hygroscopicus]ASQ97480.1 NmrA family transcriptional regulator [Streptomyces sp. 11-1-2]